MTNRSFAVRFAFGPTGRWHPCWTIQRSVKRNSPLPAGPANKDIERRGEVRP